MRNFKEISEPILKIDTVVCNMCGQPIKRNEFDYLDDYLSIEKKWGFGSSHDGETHTIDICQSCYEKFAAKLKIPPSND